MVMEESMDIEIEDGIRGRFPIWLAYGFITLLVIWVVLEAKGVTNWVSYSLPLSASDFALIASAVGTVVLTFGLLLLYDKQAQIQRQQAKIQNEQTSIQGNQESLMEEQTTIQGNQESLMAEQTTIQGNQESLMEQQFMPYLTGEVAPLNITSAQFLIRNSGDGPAYEVR
ncbi:MAG: hypothetical protein ACQEP0_09090 [Natrinema limicola]